MIKSEAINELAASLAKAQAKIEGAIKDKSNPAFRSKYADLGACWDAIRGPLTENGLSIVQFPKTLDGAVEVETILLHQSGQYMSDVFAIPVSKRDAHGYMSATTYARRGALMAVAGIAPVDDDGNLAAGKNGAHADPIHEAKERVFMDDPHLLTNGPDDKRSQYEVTKAANGGKTPYMTDKIARIREWKDEQIAELRLMPADEVEDWWNEPERKKKLDWMQKNMAQDYQTIWLAAEKRIGSAQRTPMEAG